MPARRKPCRWNAAAFCVLCLLAPFLALAASWLRPEIVALRERLGEL
jgi:hypothetical protein